MYYKSVSSLTVFCAILTLTFVVANVGASAGAKTKSCCWPEHFQAWMGRFAGMPAGGSEGVFEEEFLIEFDLPKNRWAFWLRDYYVTNEYTEIIYIEDYNTNKLTVANFQGCYTVPMNRTTNTMTLPCIPDDAEFLETQRMGEGVDSLFIDIWKWDIDHIWNGEKSRTRINAAFFPDCQPHSEIAWWFAAKFNYSSYLTFLDMNVGEGEDSPFTDLSRYYTCKEAGYVPRSIDARPHAYQESLYIMQRVGGTTYDPTVPEEPTSETDDDDST